MESNMQVHVSDFDKICRTCLSTQEIQSIFDLKHNETPIVSLLEPCASIHVEKDDDLPQNLCSACLQEIITIHQFQEKCRKNDSFLRYNLIEQKVVKQEVFDDEIIKQVEQLETPLNDSNSERETNKITQTEEKHLRLEIKEEIKIFSCRVCSEKFTSNDELKEHQKKEKHQKIRKDDRCSVCGIICHNSSLSRHMRTHTKEKPYKCTVCPKSFTWSDSLKRHMMMHTGERPYVCRFCGKGFIRPAYLKEHIKMHPSNEQVIDTPELVCSVCGKKFIRFNAYKFHLKKHDLDKLQVKEKILVQGDLREHVCKICKRAYQDKRLLTRHLLTHGEKKFFCNDCGKGFFSKTALKIHLRVHTREKPYSCSICKKSFGHANSLEDHMWRHNGQKPYSCNVCTKSYTKWSHLKKHLCTHSGEKPYTCTHCGKSFVFKWSLTVHVRLHTGEKPYKCSVCGKCFHNPNHLKKHQSSHELVNLQLSDGDNVVDNDSKE